MITRVVLIVFVVALVNLPAAEEGLTTYRLGASGRTVSVPVLEASRISGRGLVSYRLPVAAGAGRQVFSARLDTASYDEAITRHRIAVRYLPADPQTQRPVGRTGGSVFFVVAGFGDTVAVALLVLVHLRRRRWQLRVLSTGGDLVRIGFDGHELVARLEDPNRASALRVGHRLPQGWGRGLRLVATADVRRGLPVGELEPVDGASYVARGRVDDARRRGQLAELRLRLDNGFLLPVEVGTHRSWVEYRDHAEVPGTLVLRT